MNATETPQVYIACLASYNAGRLIGEWTDATDIENFNEAVAKITVDAIKAATDAGEFPLYFGVPEEFAIHDYSAFPGSVVSSLGEYPDWKRVVAIALLLEDDNEKTTAWLRFVDNISDIDSDDMETVRDEQCIGQAESEESYAMEYVTDTGGWGNVPSVIEFHNGWQTVKIKPFEELESYIDWGSIAQELFDHGTLSLINGYVFDSER